MYFAFGFIVFIVVVPLIAWAAQREFRCPRCEYKHGDDYLVDQEIKARRNKADYSKG